jgi:hypothetical protein
MKKLYMLILAIALVNITNAQYFTKIWTKLANGDLTWFNTGTQNNNTTGIAYNPATNKVLVGTRNDNIYILNASTGAQEGTLSLTGLGTEAFKFNKIRITSDGVIYGISLATGAGTCKIYRWADQTSNPTECASFAVTERTGDAFALSGSGISTTLYASGAQLANNTAGNGTKIYVLTTNNGTNFLNTSTIDVQSAGSQWTNRSVDPIGTTPSAGLWIDMSGGPARRLSISGTTSTVAFTTTTGYNSGQVADSYCGMRYLAPDAGGKKLLAFAGANNAGDGITMKLLDVTNEAAVTTVGTDTLWSAPNTPATYNSNGNGTGDVAFKKNGDGSYDFFYVATNNGISCVRSAQTLPVSISNFSAALRNKKVQLNWTTASEINNNGFEIEKSINGKDFSAIGKIASKAFNGNSTTTIDYSFEDVKLSAGNNYYRLKQLDKDGKTSISNIEVINNPFTGSLVINVLGNPVRNNLSLNVKSSINRNLQINISNASGNLLLTKLQAIKAGENNFLIPVSQLQNGMLFVTVKDINNNTTEQTIQLMKN